MAFTSPFNETGELTVIFLFSGFLAKFFNTLPKFIRYEIWKNYCVESKLIVLILKAICKEKDLQYMIFFSEGILITVVNAHS